MKRKLHFLLAVGIGLTASVGWLHAENKTYAVPAGDVTALKESIANAANGDTIKLASGEYKLASQLVISKPIVLSGTLGVKDALGTILVADKTAEWPQQDGKIKNSTANLISIEGTETGTAIIKDLWIKGSLASGINAQSAMMTKLENILSEGNANAGLLVVSTVEATGLRTSGNGWGGVNVDEGTPKYTIKFTFDQTSSFNEPYKIWTELTTAENVVTAPANGNWKTYSIKKYDAITKTWSEDKKYWTPSNLDLEYYSQFPKKPWANGYNFVYAKGKSIKIEQSAVHPDFTVIKDSKGDILVELPKQCHPVIIGGDKSKAVESTHITMESGTVEMLIGGGYGKINASSKAIDGDTAKVTGTTTIVMTGGTVSGSLLGGGLYYNKTNKVDISLSGTASVGIPNNWVICGGFESGCTAGTAYDDFAKSTNTVAEAVLKITGGTYNLVGIGGTDGDKGYVQKATAIVNNATITGGVYGNGSNGRSDIVNGTFNNCTFTKTTEYPIEIAGVNRGKSKDITMTFKGCTFPENPKDIYTYLGGTYQWQTNYGGSKVGVPEKVSFIFEGGTNVPTVGVSSGLDVADVIVTGAKASIDSVLVNVDSKTGKETWLKAFTLGAGKTWTFNDGLSMASGVTLTKDKTGTLKYGKSFEADVETLAEMKNALGIVNAGADSIANTINLNDNLVVPSESADWMKDFSGLEYYFHIQKPVTINGNSKSISGNFPNDDKKKYVITADYSGDKAITINDLTIEKTNATALNITWPKNVILNNVTLNENEAGALNINSAVVKATNLQTAGNRVGVRIQNENSTQHTLPHFELVSGTLKDTVQIAFHNRTVSDEKGEAITNYDALVTLPENDGYIKTWRKAELKKGKDAIVRVWANSRLANVKVGDGAMVMLDSISSGLDSLFVDYSFANVIGVMNTSVKSETFNGKDHKAATLRNGLVINCKDAYLVTGTEDAERFAANATNKTVLSLTVKDSKLVVAPLKSEQVINAPVEWNDAKNAKQNVRITEKGFLTINAPMELDTIFMAEGAQLEAKAAVTAKAVQLAYGVTKTWKAFGFPFTIGKIVGEADDKTDVKTVANDAEEGIWTAGIEAATPTFTVTQAGQTPAASCIIAAHKDSTILVTSTTTGNALISLASKSEPNAPVIETKSADVKFQIVSNPNTYNMQLTQTAYVLSADGKTFDRVVSPLIPAFQSFVLADEGTTSTLRSLRIGETPTGNEIIVPTDGYYVQTGKGSITIHTAEPVQVVVVDMLGRVYYNARVNDGAQIAVPAGIYAVNRQKVIVK